MLSFIFLERCHPPLSAHIVSSYHVPPCCWHLPESLALDHVSLGQQNRGGGGGGEDGPTKLAGRGLGAVRAQSSDTEGDDEEAAASGAVEERNRKRVAEEEKERPAPEPVCDRRLFLF